MECHDLGPCDTSEHIDISKFWGKPGICRAPMLPFSILSGLGKPGEFKRRGWGRLCKYTIWSLLKE